MQVGRRSSGVSRFDPLFQLAGPIVLAQRTQVECKIAGQAQGLGVVIA
jgi:hypothetical protein